MIFSTKTGKRIEITSTGSFFRALDLIATSESDLRAKLANRFGPEATARELTATAWADGAARNYSDAR